MTGASASNPTPALGIGYLGVLRIRHMPAIMAAHTISLLGTVAAEVALSLLVYHETRSAFYAAAAIAAGFIPQALSAVLLSAIAERFPPRAALVCANLVSTVLAASLALPGLPAPLLLAAAAVLGAIIPLHNGVRAAALADLLTPAAFASARSLLREISRLTLIFGFFFGGTMAGIWGPATVLLGNAVSFAVAAALLRWGTPAGRHQAATAQSQERLFTASLRGVRYVLTDPVVRVITASLWLPLAFASVGSGLAVAYTAQVKGNGLDAGLLFAAFAVGSSTAEAVGTRFPVSARQRAVPTLMLATQLPALGFLAVPPIAVAALLRALSGMGVAYLQGLDLELLPALKDTMWRRSMALVSAGVMACQGVAMATAGALAEIVPPGQLIGASGIAGTVVCLALLAARHRRPHVHAAAPRAVLTDADGKGCHH